MCTCHTRPLPGGLGTRNPNGSLPVDIWSLALISSLLLLCALGLMALHVRTWRRAQQQPLQPDDLDYHRRQYRRRMQTSAMLGLMAVAILVGQLATSRIESKLVVCGYWGVVLLMVGWVGLLAVADMLATKHHFNRLRQTYLIEQLKLHAELRRIRAARGNGKAPKSEHEPESRR
jgi:hypothetical protein